MKADRASRLPHWVTNYCACSNRLLDIKSHRMPLESGEPNSCEMARSSFDGNRPYSLDDMEACYAYVNLLARASAYRCFQIKLDPEDLATKQLPDSSEVATQLRAPIRAIKAWLRSVVSSVLHDLADKAWAGKRDIGKEQSLDAALDESSARVEAFFPAEHFHSLKSGGAE